ncbi:MAG: hypothetical protein Q9160_006721 [Pyrenula sp. 1 TL-2023]
MNLVGPPFPYTQESSEEWTKILSKATGDALKEYREAQDADGKKWVGQLPVSAIREVDTDSGEGRFIGEVTIRRRAYETVTDPAERKRLEEENEALKVGDPEIKWAFGFYLSPTRRGRGIMPAVVRTLLDDFLNPHMNVHHMMCDYLEHNTASRRVFEKVGFSLVGVYPDVIELSEVKTGVKGKKVGLGVLEWKRKEQERKA